MSLYEIIVTLIVVVFGGISYYYKTKSKLNESASELVAVAEKEYAEFEKAGSDKLAFCVKYLYTYIPAPVKVFFPESALELIVETALSNMKSFAKTQLDKLDDKTDTAVEGMIDKLTK